MKKCMQERQTEKWEQNGKGETQKNAHNRIEQNKLQAIETESDD